MTRHDCRRVSHRLRLSMTSRNGQSRVRHKNISNESKTINGHTKVRKLLAELFAILYSKLNHVQNIRDSARAVPVRSHNYNELRHQVESHQPFIILRIVSEERRSSLAVLRTHQSDRREMHLRIISNASACEQEAPHTFPFARAQQPTTMHHYNPPNQTHLSRLTCTSEPLTPQLGRPIMQLTNKRG